MPEHDRGRTEKESKDNVSLIDASRRDKEGLTDQGEKQEPEQIGPRPGGMQSANGDPVGKKGKSDKPGKDIKPGNAPKQEQGHMIDHHDNQADNL